MYPRAISRGGPLGGEEKAKEEQKKINEPSDRARIKVEAESALEVAGSTKSTLALTYLHSPK